MGDASESLTLEERIKIQTRKPKATNSQSSQPKKRANKNRPREMSSKRPVRDPAPVRASKRFVDPRFDNIYGEFNERDFKQNYDFVDQMKQRDIDKLVKASKKEKDRERQKQIKEVLKRTSDRERELEKVKALRQKAALEKVKVAEALALGKPARFKTKAESKISDLVDKFGSLKEKGKLLKYIKKKNKKTSLRSEIGFSMD